MNLRRTYHWLLLAVLAVCLTSCEGRRNGHGKDDRLSKTVVIYMVAENSLSYGNFHTQDQEEICRVAGSIPKDCRVVLYVDDTDYPRIYSVEPTKDGTNLKVLKAFTSEADSCDPEMLKKVMYYVTNKYPSKSYGFVFWSHGSAWLPASASAPMRSIGVDNGRNKSADRGGSEMDIDELAEALEEVENLDFILFDACFMQSVEVAYELRKAAHFIISSPAEIPGPGAPYDVILPYMLKPSADIQGIVNGYYGCYATENSLYGVVLSAVDCRKLEALRDETRAMLLKYGSMEVDNELTRLLKYYPLSDSSVPEYFDMKAYMHHIITDEVDWQTWLVAFEAAVPFKQSTERWYSKYIEGYMYMGKQSDFGGVSMYVPEPGGFFLQKNNWFRDTAWYSASGWRELGW